ncbi:hypothetical protein SBA3_80006 [Candidatus Sulfopaludibacter sp. SbA3]|nr:hypothetical protein SBA3_80006 [Candidatus Sulfopaludibacter sp. SbA3]
MAIGAPESVQNAREQFGIRATWIAGPKLVYPNRSQNPLVAAGPAYQLVAFRAGFLFLAVTEPSHRTEHR